MQSMLARGGGVVYVTACHPRAFWAPYSYSLLLNSPSLPPSLGPGYLPAAAGGREGSILLMPHCFCSKAQQGQKGPGLSSVAFVLLEQHQSVVQWGSPHAFTTKTWSNWKQKDFFVCIVQHFDLLFPVPHSAFPGGPQEQEEGGVGGLLQEGRMVERSEPKVTALICAFQA